ncbi:HAD family hydrolase [Paenibacillus albidus]|uniref:HAD family hydrolase n=1 Tax=Paenibacillus albidus TaxID=2041023 RepID=UPI001BEAC113|nr:HAD family hydrolase [Paenibacillus albidus]MBT2288659.1 HAD family hydrolase [Paenibacillus albidus]
MPILHVKNRAVACRGILFDKDGTLLNLMATWGSWAELVLRAMDDQLTLSGLRLAERLPGILGTRHSAGGKLSGYDPAGPLAMATAEETYGILAWQLYAAGVPWNEAIARVKSIDKEANHELRRRRTAEPLPGLLPFLERCEGAALKLGVVTSDGGRTTGEHLEWLGISGYFRSVVTRERVRTGKPAPEMAELACRELDLLPAETVIIGDSNADMQLGKGAGLALCVGLCAEDGGSAHLLDADVIIRDFSELRISV